VHAILALVLLVVATALGVYKPFGLTAYGKRKQHEQRQEISLMYVAGIIAVGILLVFALMHLTGGALKH
jgi:hypothetical protein